MQEETSATIESNIPPAVYQIAGNIIGREDKNGGHQLGVVDPDEHGAFTLNTTDRHAVAFAQNTRDEVRLIGGNGDVAGALAADPGMKQTSCVVQEDISVRRLTLRECERLQGFPDDWTLITYRGKPAGECPDTPRYKALGNSMAVPVMRWIGERIQEVMDREETEE